MSANQQHQARADSHLHMNTGSTRAIRRGIAAMARDNARRVPCAHCDLRILPEGMDRHIELLHDE